MQLTARDLDLLTLLGLTGYGSTDQLAREFFPSADRCGRRVRALFDAGYLTITLWGSTKPNLVSLTRQGLAAVEQQQPHLQDRLRLAGAIRLPGVPHHLAVVDTRLYLAALGRSSGTPLTRWSNAGGGLGREFGLNELGLAPDGLAELDPAPQGCRAGPRRAVGAGRAGGFWLACEVDCGTEPGKVIAGKLERYAEAFSANQLDELWLVVAAGATRQERLAELVREQRLGLVTRIVPHALTTVRPVEAPPARVGPRPQGPAPDRVAPSAGVVLAAADGRAAGPNTGVGVGQNLLSIQTVTRHNPTVDRPPVRRAVG